MSTALELYQGVVRFMDAGIGMQPSRKDELVASQRVHLVTAWSRLSTISPDDSSAVLEALSGDTDSFPRDVRDSLAGALFDIVTSGSASNASSEVRSNKTANCADVVSLLVGIALEHFEKWGNHGEPDAASGRLHARCPWRTQSRRAHSSVGNVANACRK